AAALLVEAVAAVHRTVAPRDERHPGLAAAGATGDRVQLALPALAGVATAVPARGVAVPGVPAVAGRPAGGLPALPARPAALGLVGEPALRVEGLLVRGEHELRAAVLAGQHLILIAHRSCPFPVRFVVGVCERLSPAGTCCTMNRGRAGAYHHDGPISSPIF